MATIKDLCDTLNGYQEGLGDYVMETYGDRSIGYYDHIEDVLCNLFIWDDDPLGLKFWVNIWGRF